MSQPYNSKEMTPLMPPYATASITCKALRGMASSPPEIRKGEKTPQAFHPPTPAPNPENLQYTGSWWWHDNTISHY